MKLPEFNLKQLKFNIFAKLISLKRYSLIIFIVFVAGLYGFVLIRVNNLTHAQPLATDISEQVKAAAIPHIDQAIVKKLQSLQDNSVSVQSLFDQARSNPFQ